MEHNCDAYVRIPYPKLSVEGKNDAYANILLSLYAGRISEMTAVSTYSYQTVQLKESHPEASTLMKCISITEMKHFDILAALIKMLGTDPRLVAPAKNMSRRNRYFWWTGEYVNYAKDYNTIIDSNIAAEKSAIAEYKRAIQMIADKGITDVIERIILDEEKHIEIFESLKNK